MWCAKLTAVEFCQTVDAVEFRSKLRKLFWFLVWHNFFVQLCAATVVIFLENEHKIFRWNYCKLYLFGSFEATGPQSLHNIDAMEKYLVFSWLRSYCISILILWIIFMLQIMCAFDWQEKWGPHNFAFLGNQENTLSKFSTLACY